MILWSFFFFLMGFLISLLLCSGFNCFAQFAYLDSDK